MKPYISKLTATGLKSGDFSHDLGRVTLFKGPSGSGKTSRLNALRLVLCGADPTVGRLGAKTGAAIMDLARGSSILTLATDSLGRTRECGWARKGESVKATPPKGDMPEAPAILIDPGEYFGLSDAKKIEYVFGLCPMDEASEFTGEAIVASIRNLSLAENNEHTVTTLRALAVEIDQADSTRHEMGESIQQWLKATIEGLKVRLKTSKANCDRMTKTVQGITQIGANEEPAPNLHGELGRARDEKSALSEVIGTLTESLRSYSALVAKVTAKKMALEGKTVVPTPEIGEQVAALEAQIEALANDATEDQAFTTKLDAIDKQVGDLQTAIRAHTSDLPGLQQKVADLRSTEHNCARDLDANAKKVVSLVNALNERLTRPCCSECGTPTKEIAATLKAAHQSAMEALAVESESLAFQSQTTKKQIAEIDQRIAQAQQRDADIDAKRAKISALQIDSGKLMAERGMSSMKKDSRIHAKRTEIRQLEQARGRAVAANEGYNAAVAELKTLHTELAEWNPDAIRAKAAETATKRSSLETDIANLEEKQRAFQRTRDDEQRNAMALMEHAQSKAECTVLAAVIETLDLVQTRMVETAFGKLLSTVNRFTNGSVMPAPIEYRAGELGYFRASTWVSHKTFSGTEKAMTYAGLAAALAESAPVVVVTLDEMGVMDLSSMIEFLNRMVELTKQGVIGQFIGCWSSIPGHDFSLPEVVTINV